jgi:hypothetical protein
MLSIKIKVGTLGNPFAASDEACYNATETKSAKNIKNATVLRYKSLDYISVVFFPLSY